MVGLSILGGRDKDTAIRLVCIKLQGLPQCSVSSVISDSFVDHDGYSISSDGFRSTVVDIMVI